MINNKGFSLIEILATIVIIGIVSTVGIVSVNSMINKSKQHFYESQKQQMVLAAQSYVQDNRNILPKNVGGMIKIKLSVLREKNYLKEDIIDQDKNVCDQDNSYVTVYKNNQTEYKYHGYLDCPACKKNGAVCYEDDGELKPVISIDFPDTNNQGNALFNKNKKISIIMKATNDDDHPTIKIASYSYKIYVDNVLKFDSGIKIDNKRITNTRSISKYLNNNYIYEKEELNIEDTIEYEIILGLRLIKGINLNLFKEKYHKDLINIYNYNELINNNILILKDNYLSIPEDKIYISNEIIVKLLQSKI